MMRFQFILFCTFGSVMMWSLEDPVNMMPKAECKWDYTQDNFIALTLIDENGHEIVTMKHDDSDCIVAVGSGAFVSCNKGAQVLSVRVLLLNFVPGETRTYICNATMYDERQYDHKSYRTNATREVQRKDAAECNTFEYISLAVALILLVHPGNYLLYTIIRAKCCAPHEKSDGKDTPSEELPERENLLPDENLSSQLTTSATTAHTDIDIGSCTDLNIPANQTNGLEDLNTSRPAVQTPGGRSLAREDPNPPTIEICSGDKRSSTEKLQRMSDDSGFEEISGVTDSKSQTTVGLRSPTDTFNYHCRACGSNSVALGTQVASGRAHQDAVGYTDDTRGKEMVPPSVNTEVRILRNKRSCQIWPGPAEGPLPEESQI